MDKIRLILIILCVLVIIVIGVIIIISNFPKNKGYRIYEKSTFEKAVNVLDDTIQSFTECFGSLNIICDKAFVDYLLKNKYAYYEKYNKSYYYLLNYRIVNIIECEEEKCLLKYDDLEIKIY